MLTTPATTAPNYNFGLFWTGQTLSALGTSFTSFALPLLIFNLTHSPVNLAFTVVAGVIPYLLFGLPMGALADRMNRRRFMLQADVGRAMAIASIPLVAEIHGLSVWWIYGVTFINATLSIGFDAANFAAVPNLVPRQDILMANSRLQASYSIAKVVGPACAGILILVLAIPQLLLVDAASFIVSAISLAVIRTPFNTSGKSQPAPQHLREAVSEGLRYVRDHPVVRWLTLLLLLINFILPIVTSQVVLFAHDWLGANNSQVGFFYAAGSLGTASAALFARRLQKRWSFGILTISAMFAEGIFIVLTAVTANYGIALLCWAARGGADIIFLVSSYSLVQTLVPDHLLSRVITFIRVLTWPTGAVGAVLGGFIITTTHTIAPIYIGVGIATAGIAILFGLTPLWKSQ